MSRLDTIAARADASQIGSWPTDPVALGHLLAYSTSSRVFVAHARQDVLALVRVAHAAQAFINARAEHYPESLAVQEAEAALRRALAHLERGDH